MPVSQVGTVSCLFHGVSPYRLTGHCPRSQRRWPDRAISPTRGSAATGRGARVFPWLVPTWGSPCAAAHPIQRSPANKCPESGQLWPAWKSPAEAELGHDPSCSRIRVSQVGTVAALAAKQKARHVAGLFVASRQIISAGGGTSH